ncbi:MAG: ABC transporter substrate-binding protein [Chloroflexi bacterium]|nr:ABC transporter substrate-binding protein [Chloroflexota bacterium]
MGETRVPVNAQRVVVLDTGELDSAIALGVVPVGAVTVFQGGDFPEYLRPRAAGIEKVGTIGQPNLEAVAALRPDLILSNKVRHEQIYDKLSQIAPTVFTETVGVAWKENFQLHAESLGRSEQASQMMADYRARLDQFRGELGGRLGETEVSIIRSMPDRVRIYMKDSFIGTILDDAGLPRPPVQDHEKFAEEVTKERVADMDGDVIFVGYFAPEQGAQLNELKSDPLWPQLTAVRSGRVYDVSDDTWFLGIGILAANRVVDDLFTFLGRPTA